MGFVSGKLVNAGAIIEVQVGVGVARRQVLESRKIRVPDPIFVKAIIDTGSFLSACSPRIFEELGISPVSYQPIRTASTEPGKPHDCPVFDVSLAVIANARPEPLPITRLLEFSHWGEEEGAEAVMGRDLLAHCCLDYRGAHKTFTLSF